MRVCDDKEIVREVTIVCPFCNYWFHMIRSKHECLEKMDLHIRQEHTQEEVDIWFERNV